MEDQKKKEEAGKLLKKRRNTERAPMEFQSHNRFGILQSEGNSTQVMDLEEISSGKEEWIKPKQKGKGKNKNNKRRNQPREHSTPMDAKALFIVFCVQARGIFHVGSKFSFSEP
ncbi:hypothetical protein JTB14_028621 [Gonioctena quinquepunctata]|nr:hypothetical protein JTB14_028621 [Gonioctena quinquepunctata]